MVAVQFWSRFWQHEAPGCPRFSSCLCRHGWSRPTRSSSQGERLWLQRLWWLLWQERGRSSARTRTPWTPLQGERLWLQRLWRLLRQERGRGSARTRTPWTPLQGEGIRLQRILLWLIQMFNTFRSRSSVGTNHCRSLFQKINFTFKDYFFIILINILITNLRLISYINSICGGLDCVRQCQPPLRPPLRPPH